jgi:fructoselysine-6-P-deglycase FrlB-like protein
MIQRALFSAEKRSAIDHCKVVLGNPRDCYVIGTGGSYTVAQFISQLLSSVSGVIAQPMKPFDYYRIGGNSELLIVVSYSGSTSDCELAIKKAIDRHVSQIVIVTATERPRLRKILRSQDAIISYGNQKRERGFISIAGTVAPCTLWTAAATSTIEIAKLVSEIAAKINGNKEILMECARLIKKRKVLHAIGGGYAWPAVIDLESKFTEGAIGPIQIHESKDFSHGRFINVFNDIKICDPMVLVRVPNNDGYEDELSIAMSKHGPLLDIHSSHPGILGALDVLVEIQYAVKNITSYLEIDISRPRYIDSSGRRLYKWKFK